MILLLEKQALPLHVLKGIVSMTVIFLIGEGFSEDFTIRAGGRGRCFGIILGVCIFCFLDVTFRGYYFHFKSQKLPLPQFNVIFDAVFAVLTLASAILGLVGMPTDLCDTKIFYEPKTTVRLKEPYRIYEVKCDILYIACALVMVLFFIYIASGAISVRKYQARVREDHSRHKVKARSVRNPKYFKFRCVCIALAVVTIGFCSKISKDQEVFSVDKPNGDGRIIIHGQRPSPLMYLFLLVIASISSATMIYAIFHYDLAKNAKKPIHPLVDLTLHVVLGVFVFMGSIMCALNSAVSEHDVPEDERNFHQNNATGAIVSGFSLALLHVGGAGYCWSTLRNVARVQEKNHARRHAADEDDSRVIRLPESVFGGTQPLIRTNILWIRVTIWGLSLAVMILSLVSIAQDVPGFPPKTFRDLVVDKRWRYDQWICVFAGGCLGFTSSTLYIVYQNLLNFALPHACFELVINGTLALLSCACGVLGVMDDFCHTRGFRSCTMYQFASVVVMIVGVCFGATFVLIIRQWSSLPNNKMPSSVIFYFRLVQIMLSMAMWVIVASIPQHIEFYNRGLEVIVGVGVFQMLYVSMVTYKFILRGKNVFDARMMYLVDFGCMLLSFFGGLLVTTSSLLEAGAGAQVQLERCEFVIHPRELTPDLEIACVDTWADYFVPTKLLGAIICSYCAGTTFMVSLLWNYYRHLSDYDPEAIAAHAVQEQREDYVCLRASSPAHSRQYSPSSGSSSGNPYDD